MRQHPLARYAFRATVLPDQQSTSEEPCRNWREYELQRHTFNVLLRDGDSEFDESAEKSPD